MIHLRYRNGKSIDGILFRQDLWCECYIDSIIERPEYPVQNETREDQSGDEHRLFQRWNKQRMIRTKGVESMCDALSLLPLMDEVYVNEVRVYDVITNIIWDDEIGCLADIEITFSTRKAIKTF